jgi:hypothetical protein
MFNESQVHFQSNIAVIDGQLFNEGLYSHLTHMLFFQNIYHI